MNKGAFLIQYFKLSPKCCSSYKTYVLDELIRKIRKLHKNFDFTNQSLSQLSSYKPKNPQQALLLIAMESIMDTLKYLGDEDAI